MQTHPPAGALLTLEQRFLRQDVFRSRKKSVELCEEE